MLAAPFERGVLQHRIAASAIAQIVQAHELVETGKAIGNVVIELA